MKKVLLTLLFSYTYTLSAQLLGVKTPGPSLMQYFLGYGIQMNNGNILMVNSIGDTAFAKVLNLYPAGGFYTPATSLSPNSNPAIIKHMSDDRYVVASFHQDYSLNPIDDTFEISRHLPNGLADSTFNGNGRFFKKVPKFFMYDPSTFPYDLEILNDNSIIITYHQSIGVGLFNMYAVRIKSTGIVDSSFGTNGIIVLPLDYLQKPYVAGLCLSKNIPVLEDNSNHIYFGGQKNYLKCLIRYNHLGVFDTSYGYKVSSDSGDVSRLILDYSGDILAMGHNNLWAPGGYFSNPVGWFIRKYKANGTLDANYGVNGEFQIPADILSNAFLQPDGKIVLFGQKTARGNIYAKKIKTDGTLDNGWWIDTNYYQCGNYSQENIVGTSFMQNDGKIVANIGIMNICVNNQFQIYRFSNDPCGNGNTIPTQPILTASNLSFCQGALNSDTISISGNLNAASYWEYYTNFNPLPVQVYGNSFVVTPGVTTTYYVRGAGYCSGYGPVGSITITYSAPQPLIIHNNYMLTCSNVDSVNYQWFLNNNAIGSNDSTLTISQNGTYVVVTNDSSGCTGTDTLEVTALGTMSELSGNAYICLYPNPASGMIHIQHNEKLKDIQIFDMVGKLIINQKCAGEIETNIDLSNLPNGVYHVKAAGYNSIKVIKNN